MPTPVSYTLTSPAPSPAPASPSAPTTAPVIRLGSARAFLGYGLLAPFRRDQRGDFVSGGDVELVKACVAQVLGVQGSDDVVVGELPWRPEFGSVLHRLKHRGMDAATQQLAAVFVADALERWEPRVKLKSVSVSTAASVSGGPPDTLVVSLVYDIIKANTPGNQVVVPDVSQDVKV